MTEIKYNRSEVVLKHIDNAILKMISEKKSLEEIIVGLESRLSKFEMVIDKCKPTELRWKFLKTHNLACRKRIEDFKFAQKLKFNYFKFAVYSNSEIFELLRFKDKISWKKFFVDMD